MEIQRLVSAHLPMALVASVVVILFNAYTGEISEQGELITVFTLHVFAIFVEFVAFDAMWDRAFEERGA